MGFAYHRAETLSEVTALLDQRPDEAKLLAGGQSLLPLLKLRLAQPRLLIDLGRLDVLRQIQDEDGRWRVGALVTHRQLRAARPLTEHLPVVHDAAGDIGDPLVRNRGTIGGALAHADPAGDWPAVALAIDARLHATSSSGDREIGVDEFFAGSYTSALEDQEVLTHLTFAKPEACTRSAYVKFSHPASGYAVAAAAAVITVDAEGVCRRARLALTGIAATPYRAHVTEDALGGRELTQDLVRSACAAVTDGIEVLGDTFAPVDYRRHLASVVARRAIDRALSRSS